MAQRGRLVQDLTDLIAERFSCAAAAVQASQ